MRSRRGVAWIALAVALIACGDGLAVPGSSTTSTSTPIVSPTTTEPTRTPDPITDAAVADLAGRLDVPESDITLFWSKAVSWPDGALGCPQPGMMYTQAIVEGTQLVLQVGDRYFDYHAGSQGEPFLCESNAADGGHVTPPSPPGITR